MSVDTYKVGMISPPAWFNFFGDELSRLTPSQLSVMNTQMRFADGFGYTLAEMYDAVDEVEACACALAESDVDFIMQIGTPFSTIHGWERARQLETDIENKVGVPIEMMGLSLVRVFHKLGLKTAAVSTVYYEADWTSAYRDFLVSSGIEILYAGNFVEQAIVPKVSVMDSCHHEFPIQVLERSVERVCEFAPSADAVIISGIPCPLLDSIETLHGIAGRPVISYLAVYTRVLARLGISIAFPDGIVRPKNLW